MQRLYPGAKSPPKQFLELQQQQQQQQEQEQQQSEAAKGAYIFNQPLASDTFQHAHFIPIIVYNGGCGKREAHIDWSMVTCKGSTRYWNYLEEYWPCACGLSAVNAIGTPLRDPINSGLAR